MEDQMIQLDSGTATIGEVVLDSGAIRHTLEIPPVHLTRHDCAVIAGALLGRSHAPIVQPAEGA
jgi:hypothetical protein